MVSSASFNKKKRKWKETKIKVINEVPEYTGDLEREEKKSNVIESLHGDTVDSDKSRKRVKVSNGKIKIDKNQIVEEDKCEELPSETKNKDDTDRNNRNDKMVDKVDVTDKKLKMTKKKKKKMKKNGEKKFKSLIDEDFHGKYTATVSSSGETNSKSEKNFKKNHKEEKLLEKQNNNNSNSTRKSKVECELSSSKVKVTTLLPSSTSSPSVFSSAYSLASPCSSSAVVTNRYPYPVDYCDHFETSYEAYKDIDPFLQALSNYLGKKNGKKELKIYDPYFCAGSTIEHLSRLGYLTDNIYHWKRDFYKDIEQNKCPNDFDVLLTNPPYSDDHKERCLQYTIECQRPTILLLPSYIATKNYFAKVLHLESNEGEFEKKNIQKDTRTWKFFVPSKKYSYDHPEGTGYNNSPFFSLWFLFFPNKFYQSLPTELQRKLKIQSDLFQEGIVKNTNRMSNKRRKKMKAKLFSGRLP